MLWLVTLALIGDDFAPAHAGNAVLATVRAEGLSAVGARAELPEPTFGDGQSAEAQREALREVAGSERAMAEMVRDSVSAPHVLRLRDLEGEGGTIRAGDLYFVLHADLDAIDPAQLAGVSEAVEAEAGNLRFSARAVEAKELEKLGIAPPGPDEWVVHSAGRLLDRIAVETTSRLAASRSERSLVVAGRSDERFGAEGPIPNRWATFDRRTETTGAPRAYEGGAGYAKITRLEGMPGALMVEVHFAFAEPEAWFRGAPALRSKLGLAARDAIRRLRRELAD